MEKLFSIMEEFVNLQPWELQMALVCTMFDHICESQGLDKQQTLAAFVATVTEANETIGGMYP